MTVLSFVTETLDRFARSYVKAARERAVRLTAVEPERALPLLAAAAEQGDAEAAYMVGERYLEGNGTLRSPVWAARWYRRAAEAGHVRAQCRLAALHLLGVQQFAVGLEASLFDLPEWGRPDFDAALTWAKRAAVEGAADAQAMLGFILSSGPAGLRDCDSAFEWYRESAGQDCPQGRLGYAIALTLRADDEQTKLAAHRELVRAADAGLPAAHYLLGVAAERGAGAAQDKAEARRRYTVAAEAGLSNAQARLALLLLDGCGGPQDLEAGESWLRRAADGGDSEAAAQLGGLYAKGIGQPPDYIEAAYWFRTAAERGNKDAARSLGTLYLTGAGVTQDVEEAAVWFKRAAEAGDPCAQADLAKLMQAETLSVLAHEPPPLHEWFAKAAGRGDPIAAYNYAVCLAEGIGVPRDDERAVYWLKRASEKVVSAQYWYGRMLAEGRGVAKDEAGAAAWFARAAQAGMAEAQEALGRLNLNGSGVA